MSENIRASDVNAMLMKLMVFVCGVQRQRMGSNGHYVDDTMRDEDSPNGHISV